MKQFIILTILAWSLSSTSQAAPIDLMALETGKKTYNAFCIYCHGAKGEGDGQAAALNGVPLVDISNKAYMSLLSDQDIYDRIAYGKEKFPYIQMPGWRSNLKPQEIKAVVVYVRSLAVDKGALKGPTPKEREERFNNSSAEKGRIYYLKYCSTCHGRTGDGKGPVANTLKLKPACFNDPKITEQLTTENVKKYVTDISEERGRYMPIFEPFIEEYIDEIVQHIKTLAK
ncbi:MAG: c-type cytochrome [Candidatus Polarisedimenticolaceae bacterium]|nr:c-type cytochrome [Candidatus Polarisedimenticolaceae bacterium]